MYFVQQTAVGVSDRCTSNMKLEVTTDDDLGWVASSCGLPPAGRHIQWGTTTAQREGGEVKRIPASKCHSAKVWMGVLRGGDGDDTGKAVRSVPRS